MPRRCLPALIGPVALFVGLFVPLFIGASARTCPADEVFRLRNGTILKGDVLKEDGQGIVLRLSGFRSDARVTIDSGEVLHRYRTDAPVGSPAKSSGRVPEVVARTTSDPAEATAEKAEPDDAWRPRAALPEPEAPEEPRLSQEGFFQRMARVAEVGLPKSPPGQLTLALLLLVGLLTIVMLGGRMAEIESLSFLRASFLALLLGGFLAADVFWRDQLLRADRALWVLPAQGAAWLAGAILTLRENPARVVLLFAFVLFSLAMVVFSAGAILVAY